MQKHYSVSYCTSISICGQNIIIDDHQLMLKLLATIAPDYIYFVATELYYIMCSVNRGASVSNVMWCELHGLVWVVGEGVVSWAQRMPGRTERVSWSYNALVCVQKTPVSNPGLNTDFLWFTSVLSKYISI
jgi:hypothetical protein